jgi:hypothetical protein
VERPISLVRRCGREARALRDDLVSAKVVQRAVCEDGILDEGHSFVRRAVTRDDRGGPPRALEQHIVETARLLGGEVAPKSSRKSRSGASQLRSSHEGAGEEGLTHADGTAEDDVRLLGRARGRGRDRS